MWQPILSIRMERTSKTLSWEGGREGGKEGGKGRGREREGEINCRRMGGREGEGGGKERREHGREKVREGGSELRKSKRPTFVSA